MTAEEVHRIAKGSGVADTYPSYKLRSGYVLRDFFGESIVVPVGPKDTTVPQTSVLNPVGAFLWQLLTEGATFPQLLSALLNEYDISVSVASADVYEFLNRLMCDSYLDF